MRSSPSASTPISPRRIAIAASFASASLSEVLAFFAEATGDAVAIERAPDGQVVPALLDPASALHRAGARVVLVRFGDLGAPRGEAVALELAAALRAATRASGATLLVCTCPEAPGAEAAGARLEAALAAAIDGDPALHLLRARDVLEAYPALSIHDAHADAVGLVPYTQAFYVALGAAVARRLHALASPPWKVVAVDADHTLWSGVCAEDGPLGVRVEAGRRALQGRLKRARAGGMLLCLVSKNHEDDVRAVFDGRDDMPLAWADFTATRVGWGDKSEALRQLAREIGVGLDAIVFLDDSPIECAEVRARCPEVLTVELPGDADDAAGVVHGLWALDAAARTAEDARRSDRYDDERRRGELRAQAPTLRDFIAGLELVVAIEQAAPDQIARVAQLTQRVNQMSSTTRRRTEAEIRALGAEILTVRVRDRLGDYGLVGAMLIVARAGSLAIESFLLSCRALGRGVEHAMLAAAARLAVTRGLATIAVELVPTAKNEPFRAFLASIGADPTALAAPLSRHPFDAATLAALGFEPAGDLAPAAIAVVPAPRATPQAERLAHIARALRSVPQIVEAMAAAAPARPRTTPFVAPRTPDEAAIARIWSDVLGTGPVGVQDGFFELGGHSVAVIRVVSRLRDAFGVELDPAVLFEGPTVERLARAVDAAREPAGSPDLASLLDELEGLGVDEADALLAACQSDGAAEGGSVPRTAPLASASRARDRCPSALAIGIVTKDRPEAVERAVASYADHVTRHDRAAEIVVFDGSREPGTAFRRAAQGHGGVALRFAGEAEKGAFAALLARQAGLPLALVRSAFMSGDFRTYACGMNRNAMLLDAAGGRVLSVDDDTLALPSVPVATRPGVDIVTGADPCDYWVYADSDAERADAAPRDIDVLAAHEALLGEDVATLRERLGEGSVRDDRGLGLGGRVRVTFPGLAGDCGWGSPFGYWHAPMGYLAFRGASRERLVAAPCGYETAWTSRVIRRAVSRVTVSDEHFSMSTFMGLDHTDVLPPFFPLGRGADLLFGVMAAFLSDELRFAHLPFTLAHAPWRTRRFWPGELQRSAAGVDLCRVTMESIGAADVPAGDAGARLAGLGDHLVGLGALPRAVFEGLIRDRLERSNARQRAFLDEQASGAGPCPGFWVRDVLGHRDVLRRSEGARDYVTPLDMLEGRTHAEALSATQALLGRFGELLRVWPAMVLTARALREEGVRLSRVLDA